MGLGHPLPPFFNKFPFVYNIELYKRPLITPWESVIVFGTKAHCKIQSAAFKY